MLQASGTTLVSGSTSYEPSTFAGTTPAYLTAKDVTVSEGTAFTAKDVSQHARKVVIVPGYGLAVAQAQHTLQEVVGLLQKRGVHVVYGIHPVAGRMPGHMNVLLAEANVPYEQLKEMDEVNSELSSTDVALVVGAIPQRSRTPPKSLLTSFQTTPAKARKGSWSPLAPAA